MAQTENGNLSMSSPVTDTMSEEFEAMTENERIRQRATFAAIYAVLSQAQDCIRGETPEDMTHEEAIEDTINKIREAMRSVEQLQEYARKAGFIEAWSDPVCSARPQPSPETAHRLADQLQTYADRFKGDWSDATPILSWEDLAVVIDALRRCPAQPQPSPETALPLRARLEDALRPWIFWRTMGDPARNQLLDDLVAACPAQPQPFGYLVKKAGVNNGYYWISPAEFERVEERFRYLYKPIYEAAAAPAQTHDRPATIEECARLVDKIGDDSYYEKDRNNATYIAKAIRALSPVPSTDSPTREQIKQALDAQYGAPVPSTDSTHPAMKWKLGPETRAAIAEIEDNIRNAPANIGSVPHTDRARQEDWDRHNAECEPVARPNSSSAFCPGGYFVGSTKCQSCFCVKEGPVTSQDRTDRDA